MSQFQLIINFANSDLDTLSQAGESVILVKTTSTPTGDSVPVAWVSFKPFTLNTVTWVENYGVYASNVSPIQGGTIAKLADTEAYGGQAYSFTNAGHFVGPNAPVTSGLTNNQYQVVNNWTDAPGLTFGVTQDLTVNGQGLLAHPLNAMLVPSGQNAVFTPLTNVMIFMESSIQSGMVLEDLRSDVTTLQFGSVTNISVRYAGGKFLQQS